MPREASVAVGKTTVGGTIAEPTGCKLFHHHLTIEPLLRRFPYGSPQFQWLNHGFREQIFAEAAVTPVPLVTPGARDSRTRARGIRNVRMLA